MGIKKGIVDLIRRLLPSNVWQTHLFKATGDNKYLKDFTIRYRIHSIQTESIKPGYQDTNMVLIKCLSTPQWNEGIRIYSAEMTKNEYDLTNIGFTTYYSALVHHLKFHV